MRKLAFVLLLGLYAAAEEPILPPVGAFAGKSRELLLPPGDPWATPFEKSGGVATPRYDETVAWLKRLVAAAPELEMVPIGRSLEGRDVWMVVAKRGEGKPTLLAQAGIHSGEIDGKDAGMMLLRDLTVRGTKRELLDGASFLFIPILSVDGHERFGPFSRVNQRGPVEMGWRTNGRNLNLNRDYTKLETAGVFAAVQALSEWQPDLYFDIHVTDGADYQYDVTWGYNGPHAHSPAIAGWLAGRLDPAAREALKAAGHVPGPLVFAVDGRDMTKGNRAPTFGPRFSHGYGDLRHLPTVLVENHSLKPYDQRVLGTYVLLEATLRALGEHGAELKAAIEKDRAARRPEVPLSFREPEGEPAKVAFLGIGQKVVEAPVIGGEWVVWTGEPVTLEIPLLAATEVETKVARPKAYWVPHNWPDVIWRLEAHGIEFERIEAAREVEVGTYRVTSYELAREPFEGRVRVEKAELEPVRRRIVYPALSVRVPTDQPLGDLAVHLLEPEAPDSFFRWGFFHGILQRTEYVENYAMVPLARLMLQRDPELKAAYEKKLAEDEAFAKDASLRLRWLYERTPYFDARWGLYPIGREE